MPIGSFIVSESGSSSMLTTPVAVPAPTIAMIVVRLRPTVSASRPKTAAPMGRPSRVAAKIALLTMATPAVPRSAETK